MPKASKRTASKPVQTEGYEGHFETFEGGYSVGFEKYSEDTDPSRFFAGCQMIVANARTGAT